MEWVALMEMEDTNLQLPVIWIEVQEAAVFLLMEVVSANLVS